MRKMERLFKARKLFIPWYHWATINFILSGIAFIALLITSCFTENVKLMLTWLIICIVYFILFFLIIFSSLNLGKMLANNALAIISKKLDKNKLDTKNTTLKVYEYTLYTCHIEVCNTNYANDQLSKKLIDEICYNLNRKFGNTYYIALIYNS